MKLPLGMGSVFPHMEQGHRYMRVAGFTWPGHNWSCSSPVAKWFLIRTNSATTSVHNRMPASVSPAGEDEAAALSEPLSPPKRTRAPQVAAMAKE